MFSVFYTLTKTRTWVQIDHSLKSLGTFAILNKIKWEKSLKPEGKMLRGVVYRLIESLATMGHSFLWKLICAISICNTLTVSVHLSSTPSISGPGSATEFSSAGQEINVTNISILTYVYCILTYVYCILTYVYCRNASGLFYQPCLTLLIY